MASERNKVFPKIVALPKHRVSALLAAGWSRAAAALGKGNLAVGKELLASGSNTTTRTIDNGLTGNTLPEAHTVLNSLAADPTALDELLAAYGFRLLPLQAEAANDLTMSAGVINAMGELIARLADGKRCHNDTLAIATLLRPHLPAMEAIVREADELRAA